MVAIVADARVDVPRYPPRTMTHSVWLQLLGYAASLLIATSLLMRSIVRLRVINLAGAATFSLYGFLIGAYPVGILNLMTASINVVQLIRLRRRTEIFRALEIRPEAPYLQYFLDFQSDDIRRFFPRFTWDAQSADPARIAMLVLRDLVPAGLFLGRVEGETLHVELDYVVPQYRDLKVATFLFRDEADLFRRRGLRRIESPADTPVHARYLERVGFTPLADGRTYRLDL
jgi:GNAT superfamily N-acetyltransferase